MTGSDRQEGTGMAAHFAGWPGLHFFLDRTLARCLRGELRSCDLSAVQDDKKRSPKESGDGFDIQCG